MRTLRRLVTPIVIVGLLIAAYAMWRDFEAERERRGAENNTMRQQISALEVTEMKHVEFEEAERLLLTQYDALLSDVPADLGVDEFLATYRRLCESLGFVVGRFNIEPKRGELYQEATVAFRMEGDMARLDDLRSKTQALPRLVRWVAPSEARERGVTIVLKIYAHTAIEETSAVDCSPIPIGFVIWPLSRRLAALENERVKLCSAFLSHGDTLQRVRVYQARKRRLEGQLALIESVRGKGTVTKSP